MTTGRTPFEGDTPYAVMNARVSGDPIGPRKVNPKISPAMEEIILHAMERDPVKRYANAAEMKAELDDYEKVELVERFRHLQQPQLWKSRFRILPLILLFVFLQIAGFFLIFWFIRHHGK
jgi:serine/threonine-protein kinase